MEIIKSNSKKELGKKAAMTGAEYIRKAIQTKGAANIVLATGASQFEMFDELVNQDVDWQKVTAFHLDEYIGMPVTHHACFQKYLNERFVDKVSIGKFNFISGNAEPQAECKRLNQIIGMHPVDVAFIGIGENAHLAFNDPPADFETEDAFIVVNLDDDSRRQQKNEGWFQTLEDVPDQAITMSIKQIMKSKVIICSVPDVRKAEAVYNTLNAEISNNYPATILRTHPNTILFLDNDSSSRL
jgi:glucosamine-6-phosphate deaminase